MPILLNAYSTLREPPPLDFPCQESSFRDRSDPEMRKQLDGFIGYVLHRAGQMTQTAYHVMRHIERTRRQLTFTVDKAALDAVSNWALRANAIFFLPSGEVADPSGEVLVPEPTHGIGQVPYPADARERKARMDALLRGHNLQPSATLPPVVGEGEVDFRDARAVAQRCMGLFVVALRAESLSIAKPIPVADLRARLPLAFDAPSPAEAAFLASDSPEQQDVVNFLWRYEALAVLQWALGLSAELPWPGAICDVPALARLAFANNNDAFAAGARLRPAGEILDALDLHVRLHWIVRQARIDGRELAVPLDPGVVQERHHALNWLVRFEDKDWDDVDTPT
jgi:hypothetical protein